MSLVTVMTWQPIASAWKMFSSSRGLAQISSACRRELQQFDRRGHQRHRVAAGVGDAAGEHRDVRRRVRPPAPATTSRTWSRVIIAVTFSLTPRVREPVNEIVGRLAAGVGHRNLDVDVLAPGGDLQRLPLHLVELVGEHLEGDRAVREWPPGPACAKAR